jgi:DNA-binding NarL/FixJ family response regulator
MKSIRILVVDDLPQVRQELIQILQLAGKKAIPIVEVVGEAQNGNEAIQQARALHPDVVLMDLEMPVMDGYEATRRIKAENPGIWVVILSIHEGMPFEKIAREAGADDFITKGVSYQILMNAILEMAVKDEFEMRNGGKNDH